jgi:site-specific recombinase XerD
LDDSQATPRNKQVIRWFIEHYKPVSNNRKDKYIRYLRQMAILVGKDFNQMEKSDVGKLLQALESRFPEEWTFVDCKTMFKTFFRFYMDEIADRPEKQDEYMRLVPVLKAVSRIETAFRKHRQKRLVILTREEIEMLLRAASDSVRELAIVTLLYHTAARPSEFLGLRVGDVEVSGDGSLYFTVAGKTGTRKLPLAADETATQVFLDWVNRHPCGTDRERSLWLNSRGEPLLLETLSIMLMRLSKRAGIRPVVPKLFRKAKLSHMADDGYNAYQIKKYAGHSKIETAMFYVELSQKGFEEAIRQKYGKSERRQALLEPKRCWKCGYVNRPFHTRCRECGTALDPTEAMTTLQQKSDLIASVMPDDMLDRLAELVALRLTQGIPGGQGAALAVTTGPARPPRTACAWQ